MAIDPTLIDQLLDVLEDLLIENRAYNSTLKHLPPQARDLADRLTAAAKADPKLRGMIRERFSPFRDQSPEQAIEGLLKLLQKNEDVN
ncbi:MAG: hypothetical protein WBE44_23450 [Terriglobales bacterium]